MKRHVHWVGLVLLLYSGFLSVYGAEISPKEVEIERYGSKGQPSYAAVA